MIAVFLFSSVTRATCGGETAAIPAYTGAASLTIPGGISSQISTNLKDGKLKNARIEACKTSNNAATVKLTLVDGFSKGGWNNAAGSLLAWPGI